MSIRLGLHIKDVNNLFDQGMVARNDVLAANVELVNAQQLVVQASQSTGHCQGAL